MTSRGKDHGWAWLVAFSACVSRALYEGIAKAMGVLLPTLATDFHQEVWVIGLTVSLMTVVGGMAALITGPLTGIFQPRWIVMACGVSTCLGMSCCALASSWATFAFCLVILTGIPMRLAFIILLSSLSNYFEEYYPVANCIAFTGSAIGITIFAPLTQFLLDAYGWKGAMMILGSISLHLMICGVVLKTSKDEDTEYKKLEGASCTRVGNNHKPANIIKRFFNWISEKLEFYHFQNPAFLACITVVFAMGYSWTGWVTYLVPYAKQRGLAPYHATSLATAGGIGHFVGTIAMALILKSQFNQSYVLIAAITISGVALVLYPISNWMFILMTISCVYGLSSASFIAVLSVCKDLTGGKLTQSISWLSVASAAGKGLSGFMTGWIFGITETYDVPFVTLGGVLLSAAGVMCVSTTHMFFKEK